ncbi:MAG: DUF4145 domain-containing protein [Johnsonella sp.]|nr:DUF4145 domain-containing protein [Johnsonella sp.]
MSNSDATNSWTYIQDGVRETERLIGQKQYNLAMLKARQTLESMVKQLSEKYNLPPSDLADTIDDLYKAHAVSKATCEHYHKIRIIGNKAAHENDNNAYNASTAYHLLSQEVYTFANDYSPRKRVRPAGRSTTHESKESRQRAAAPRSPRSSDRMQRSPARSSRQRNNIYLPDLLKFIIPVLLIIFVIVIVKSCFISKKEKTAETNTQTAATETTATIEETTTRPPETTEAESSSAAEELVYKTTSSLRVRNAPSTDADVLNVLPAGTTIVFIKKYDDKWTVINYNGAQAYVASEYLSTE